MVKEIFDAAISGKRVSEIIKLLNEKGYETPSQYYQRKHPDDKKFRKVSNMACWNNCSVRRILHCEMYYGVVVGHKRQSIGRGWKHSAKTPEEEKIIVEGKHPAIVSKEEFLEAQKVFGKKAETKFVTDKTYPLRGKVSCGTFGRALWTHWKRVKDGGYRYFYCSHVADQIRDDGCSRKWLREDELNAVVWDSVKGLIKVAAGAKKSVIERMSATKRCNDILVKKLAELQKERAVHEAERFTNMDQFMAGNLDNEKYLDRHKELTEKIEKLECKISELETSLREAEALRDDRIQEALETLESFSRATELDQGIVGAMIEKVLVYDPKHIEIRWTFPDEVMKLLNG